MDKVFYIEQLFLMTMLGLKFFFENKKNSTLNLFKYMLRLATIVPDHKLAIALFKYQGALLSYYGNLEGALRSYQKMRDTAEDIADFSSEIDAYHEAGNILMKLGSYDAALNAYKRMLQVAWAFNKTSAEMQAFDMIGKVHFYLGDITMSAYFNKRSLEGLSEVADSRAKILSTTQYNFRIGIRDGKYARAVEKRTAIP